MRYPKNFLTIWSSGYRGQTLIEVLVAIILAALLFSTLAAAISSTYRNLNVSNNQTNTNQYAHAAIEYLQSQYQAYPQSFLTYSTDASLNQSPKVYCLNDTSTSPIGTNVNTACINPSNSLPTAPNIQSYVEMFTLQKNTSVCVSQATNVDVQITVKIAWADGSCPINNLYCHISELDTCLSQPAITPGS